MDLFGDLPEPTQSQTPGEGKTVLNTNILPQTLTAGPFRHDRIHLSPKALHRRFSAHQCLSPLVLQNGACVWTVVKAAVVLVLGLPVLRGYVAARRGERDEMQDAHVVLPDMSGLLSVRPRSVSHLSYFAVFDGHGGARASKFAAENLHLTLAKKFPTGDSENLEKLIQKSLMDTFKQTDEEFLKKASSQKPSWKDGSTATCVLVVNDTVYVANLGDSRAVLCRMESSEGHNKPVTLCLSKEHNPTMYEERMRIQRAGGTVRDGRVLGVLEVSRSIGDGQYKRCGVISTPDLRRRQLTRNDRFLILACDGLFKVFSADEAVKFVLNILLDPGLDPGLDPVLDPVLDSACQQLASEAVRRGCADNVTVILVSISFPK
uniref:Integrin-linked kinase-associated serine/threonine phosphatase 2C n=1 Tax=Periophthalmus magnuspinnatus TaxID=409849 RepID=A0A3B4AFW4_9GOBI